MLKIIQSFLLAPLMLWLLASCENILPQNESENDTLFVAGVVQGVLENSEISEASGMAAGIRNEGTLWVHNDSGNKARVFCVGEKGEHLGEFFLENQKNRDWEAIVSGPGPEEGVSYLYVADIGGNWDSLEVVKVYRFPEPEVKMENVPVVDTIPESLIDVLLLRYPDGKTDAECLLLDPQTKDLYIITKGKENEVVLKAPYPQEPEKEIPLERAGKLAFSGITGGDISFDGTEVLLKTYTRIFYWKRENGQDIEDLLLTEAVELSYEMEPQGECIAWKKDGTGFFTTSEMVGSFAPELRFYKRK